MDQDFIAELDAALSNVGSDVVWKKTIGGIELWISPLQLIGQEKVADVITKMDLGANIVSESKRVTLSHSLVGIGEHDLRQYRGGAAVFPVPGKDGKPAKSTLDRYLYYKLGTWGAQFIDDVFSVYADLMETFQKDNLKEVKFDNAKDTREELAELQARVYELRQQLNMPPLVEGTEPADPDISAREGLESIDEDQEPIPTESETQAPFDPFTVMPKQPRSASPEQPVASSRPTPPEPPIPSGAAAQRAREAADIEQSIQADSSVPPVAAPTALQAAPIRYDVVDRPASREPTVPPVIDRTNVSVNPRFRRPG